MGRFHTCHALHCSQQVPPRLHMCKPHWSMVPRATQRALWAAYKPGQERTMTPSIDYLHAAAACVRAVAVAEGKDEADIVAEESGYLAWADMLREDDDDA